MRIHCLMGNVQEAREKYGKDSDEYRKALDKTCTCMGWDGHEGAHEYVPDDEIIIKPG